MAMADTPKLTREQMLKARKQALFTAMGDTGIMMRNGILSDTEYNRDLSGSKGRDTWEEMRSSDPTVRLALMAVMLPLLSSNYYVKPKSDDPRAMAAAEIVKYSFFEAMDFYDMMRQQLTFLPFGHSLAEQEFQVGQVESRDAIILSGLHFRRQQNIIKWATETGDPGVYYLRGDGKKVSIDDVKLTRWTFEQEGDNFYGKSLLRAAYKPWYLKQAMELVDGMAIEKQGLGVLKVQTPENPKPDDRDAAEDIARNQRANEEAYILEEKGFSFEFMDMKAGTLRDPNLSISRLKREILSSTMTQFLDIGSENSSGSYSASDNQLDLFFMAEESVAREFVGPLNKTAVANLCLLNGFSPEFWPTIQSERLSSDAINVFSEALNKLYTSGALTPDVESEQYIRRFLHLPEMSEEMIARYDEIRAIRKNPAASPQQINPTQSDSSTAASELLRHAAGVRDALRKAASDAAN